MSKDDAPNASAIPANDSGELFNEINPLHDSLVSWRSYAWEEPPDALRALILEAFSRQYASKKARAKRSWRLPSWLSFEFTPRLGIAMAGAAMLAVLVMAGALFIVLQNQGPALVATAENVSGSVEVNYVGSQAWTAVQEGTQFQAGDRIRS
ncbi:MAG: hypothetical protein ACK2T3_03505, partial [Candidatus Promineifilaceae bacterium]